MITLIQKYEPYDRVAKNVGVIISKDQEDRDEKIDRFMAKARNGSSILQDKNYPSYREIVLYGDVWFYFTVMLEFNL